MSHPVTGSGAAQSVRPISAFEARARRRLLDLIAVVLQRERGAPL